MNRPPGVDGVGINLPGLALVVLALVALIALIHFW